MAKEDLSAASLDQIRNILVGDHARESQKKITHVEQALVKELKSLRTETTRRLDALEASLKKTHDSLSRQLDQEAAERDDGDAALAAQIAELGKALQAKIAQVSEGNTRVIRQLRESLKAEIKELRAETRASLDEVASESELGLEELGANVVSKEDLSRFFADIALKLVDKKQIRRT